MLNNSQQSSHSIPALSPWLVRIWKGWNWAGSRNWISACSYLLLALQEREWLDRALQSRVFIWINHFENVVSWKEWEFITIHLLLLFLVRTSILSHSGLEVWNKGIVWVWSFTVRVRIISSLNAGNLFRGLPWNGHFFFRYVVFRLFSAVRFNGILSYLFEHLQSLSLSSLLLYSGMRK